MLGELDIKSSFGIGKAPKEARPINKCKIFYFDFSGNIKGKY